MNGTNHFSGNDGLKSLGLTVRAYNYCISRGISTIQQLLDYYSAHNNTFPAGQNAGYYTISELERKCKVLLASKDLDQEQKGEGETISDWHVSVRAYNVLQSYRLITKQSLLQFYRDNGNAIPDNLRNCGRKTINEIEELCRLLIHPAKLNYVPTLAQDSSSEDPSWSDKPHDKKGSINRFVNKFSKVMSFEDDDIQYLSTYNENHGHYPLLWLLSKYIESDDDILCFAQVYGIDTNKGVKSTVELAEARKVTRSRIRMRVSRGHLKLFGSHSDFNNALKKVTNEYLVDCFGKKDFISSSDRIIRLTDLNKQEGTSFTNGFILKFLSGVFKDYKTLGDYENNKPNPLIVALSKDLCNLFNFEAFFKGIDSLIEEASKEISLNLREYVEDSPCWTHFSMGDVERVLNVAKEYVLSRHGLYEDFVADTIHILRKSTMLRQSYTPS